MNFDEMYWWTSLFLVIGCLQSSTQNLLILNQYSSVADTPLPPYLVSKRLYWLKFSFNSPGIWIVAVAKMFSSLIVLVLILCNFQIHYTFPLVLVLFNQLGYLRFRLLSASETPLLNAGFVTLSIHLFFEDILISTMGMFFLASMLSLSYFAAGWHKMSSKSWRNGIAMQNFAKKNMNFRISEKISKNARYFFVLLGWKVILFELLFFISLFHPSLAFTFLILGIILHSSISLFSGINNFLGPFVSCYPAVFFVAQWITKNIY